MHMFSDDDDESFRDIHALAPAPARARTPPPLPLMPPRRRSSSEVSSSNSSENFSSMSREFNALVLAGSLNIDEDHQNLDRIGEDEDDQENNRLAIVPDINPLPLNSPGDNSAIGSSSSTNNNTPNTTGTGVVIAVNRVKKEEVEAKITAWQTAKIAKLNNRFKRETAVITGWENEQVIKASSSMNKIERKLEEKRAKALEKMENEIAKAHRKAEERRASAEGKRGTKAAKVIEVANLMRTLGRPPAKLSFF